MVLFDWLCSLRPMFSGAMNRRFRFRRSQTNQYPLLARRAQRFHGIAADTLEERLSPGNLAVGGTSDSAWHDRANEERESTNSGREPSSNKSESKTTISETRSIGSGRVNEPQRSIDVDGKLRFDAPVELSAGLLSPQLSSPLDSGAMGTTERATPPARLSPEFAGSGAFVSGEKSCSGGPHAPWEQPVGGSSGNGDSPWPVRGKSAASGGNGSAAGNASANSAAFGGATNGSATDNPAAVGSTPPTASSSNAPVSNAPALTTSTAVSDSGGSSTVISVPTQNSTGWIFSEHGGSATGKGSGAIDAGSVKLVEGDSFHVLAERAITIPENPGTLTFQYQDPEFSTLTTHDINDAFEVALVGSDGRSLVPTYDLRRDAFFNLTAGQSVALGATTSLDTQDLRVSLDISELPAGTEGRIIFRLVNNDQTTDTTVRIFGETQAPGVFAELANDTAPAGSTNASFDSDGITTDPTMTVTVSGDVELLQVKLDGGTFENITSSVANGLFLYRPGDLAAGLHEFVFRATSSAGISTDSVLSFTYDIGPTAVITGDTLVTAGSTVMFSSDRSTLNSAEIYRRTWLLPDGSTTSEVSAEYPFSEAGVFPVSLTLVDIAGATHTAVVNVEVAPVIEAAKFTVVDETSLKLFHYSASGTLVSESSLVRGNTGNTDPRGVTSNLVGDTYWVVDSNKKVYVYNQDGTLRGSWKAKGIQDPRDIATDGVSIWIVDEQNGPKLLRFAGAAARTSGSQTANKTFSLDVRNAEPTGLVFRDNSLWVTNAAGRSDSNDDDHDDH
ncbi:MAG: hypothetical protein KDB01_20625, partial [Planctomycetaceae bacterium]|nr:hypothetical protein [Planctomycetaceae bacterium]